MNMHGGIELTPAVSSAAKVATYGKTWLFPRLLHCVVVRLVLLIKKVSIESSDYYLTEYTIVVFYIKSKVYDTL